ncbi:hypothetical protein H0H92_003689 [Tricholoma furcatifolium]|nr:hypothetical protein H0H92_003689 [Tricholoma furcatifolium]
MANDDAKTLTLTFKEEPLGVGRAYGYGYFQGGPGSMLGPGHRYVIKSKLGFGATSSIEDSDGEHLCLVTELLHSDLNNCMTAAAKDGDRYLPVPVVKKIISQVLRGITNLHECGIAHTDIKTSNIMIDNSHYWTTKAIDKWLEKNPPRTYPPTPSLHKPVTVFISQPLPAPLVHMLTSCDFKLVDFSNGQFISDKTAIHTTPLEVRPPESVLDAFWDQSVDIWTFGCLPPSFNEVLIARNSSTRTVHCFL